MRKTKAGVEEGVDVGNSIKNNGKNARQKPMQTKWSICQ